MPKIKNNFTLEQKLDIIDLYCNKIWSSDKIAKKYKKNKGAILKLLREESVCIRKCSDYNAFKVNENFFKKIDTEDKAYILGLLYADGCNQGRSIIISLQEGDKYLLQKIKEKMESVSNIYKNNYRNKKNPKHKVQSVLSIYSMKLCNDLINLGCVPRKSLILKFPTKAQVPERLLNHFIRGYFDGDGYIGTIKQGKIIQFSFTGSHDFIGKLHLVLKNNLNIHTSIKKYNTFSEISSPKIWSSALLYNYLYKNATIWMDRKKQRFEQYFSKLILNTKTIGVRKSGKKWESAIKINKKFIYLGTFETLELAAAAYDTAIIELNDERYFHKLNNKSKLLEIFK